MGDGSALMQKGEEGERERRDCDGQGTANFPVAGMEDHK